MEVVVYPAVRLAGVIQPPGSKNFTTRYLLAAALAEGESVIEHVAESEDSRALQACLMTLGATLSWDGPGRLRVRGFGRHPRQPGAPLNPGNAGAVLRFLMAVCATTLPAVAFETAYVDSLGRRPHQDLLDALTALGATCKSAPGGCLPISIAGGLRGGTVPVRGEISSQFTSALLFAAPLIGEDLTIEVKGAIKSQPPIRQTLQVLAEAGIAVEAAPDLRRLYIPGGQRYQPRQYVVPGDYPGAAAIMAAAAVVESDVVIERLSETDAQGEREAVAVLQALGADVTHADGRVRVRGPLGRGAGAGPTCTFDGDRFTDAVPALVAAAIAAPGTTIFANVENLRYKECDRISDYAAELRKLGANMEERRDQIIIHGTAAPLAGGCEVDGRIDHRVIMGLAIAALRAQAPVRIRHAEHIAKSYPAFFADLRTLGARIDADE